MSKLPRWAGAFALAFVCAAPVSAQQQFTYHATVPDASTFMRPGPDCNPIDGRRVGHHALPFQVSVAGSYTIDSVQTFDALIWLYSSFDPASPLTGCLIGQDDLDGQQGLSRLANLALQPGSTYVLVTAPYGNGSGSFYNVISGPGAVTAVAPLTLNGSIARTQSRYERVDEDCRSRPGYANDVAYAARVFHVTASGNYSAAAAQDHDGFLHVYDENFNPIDPAFGCLAGDDDAATSSTSRIDSVPLAAGRSYYAVMSGYSNSQEGGYSVTIAGPGSVEEGPGHISLAGLSGLWYDPALTGSGFNIIASRLGIIFTFYGYIDGRQRWLISDLVPNDVQVGKTVSTSLSFADGGQLSAPVPGSNLVPFGTLTLTFTSCTAATARIAGTGSFAASSQNFALQRLLQGSGRDCPTP
jgi:hypothetical protein